MIPLIDAILIICIVFVFGALGADIRRFSKNPYDDTDSE